MAELEHLTALMQSVVPALIVARWQEIAAEHQATGAYASDESFETVYPFMGTQLGVAIKNNSPYAAILETGHAGFHLPQAIDWAAAEARGTAHKVEEGPRAGTRWIRVPLRHYTPGGAEGGIGSRRAANMMPQAVYDDAKVALKDARASQQRRRDAAVRMAEHPSGALRSKPYNQPYHKAARAYAVQKEGTPGYTWRATKYAGMVRREQKSATTGKTSGAYFTFRVLTEDSAGWFIPPKPGYHIAQRVRDKVLEDIRPLVAEAGRNDAVQLITEELGK